MITGVQRGAHRELHVEQPRLDRALGDGRLDERHLVMGFRLGIQVRIRVGLRGSA